jgi:hypothetical protein
MTIGIITNSHRQGKEEDEIIAQRKQSFGHWKQ